MSVQIHLTCQRTFPRSAASLGSTGGGNRGRCGSGGRRRYTSWRWRRPVCAYRPPWTSVWPPGVRPGLRGCLHLARFQKLPADLPPSPRRVESPAILMNCLLSILIPAPPPAPSFCGFVEMAAPAIRRHCCIVVALVAKFGLVGMAFQAGVGEAGLIFFAAGADPHPVVQGPPPIPCADHLFPPVDQELHVGGPHLGGGQDALLSLAASCWMAGVSASGRGRHHGLPIGQHRGDSRPKKSGQPDKAIYL